MDEAIHGAIGITRWVINFGPNGIADALAHATTVIHTAAELFRRAGNDARRELVEAVVNPLADLIPLEPSLEAARAIVVRISTSVNTGRVGELLGQVTDAALVLAGHALRRATPRALLEATGNITMAILTAFVNNFGQLPAIRDGVLKNSVNAPTLELVWGHRAELITFIVDVVECAKGLVAAEGSGSLNALQREYNELDITERMNRHGMICQLQRLVKSLVSIFQASMTVRTLADIDMTGDTTLESDLIPTPLMPLIEHIQAAPPTAKAGRNEHWLFINGIGGEYYWLGLACKKLAGAYGRKVVGIFNRGDGLLWDLVECAGQRSARQEGSTASQDSLVQATKSSADAQEALHARLRGALEKPEEELGPVVVVAHSQGCLVLRLVLQQLVSKGNQEILKKMKKSLCVFTFGNPSIHWTFEGPSHEAGGQRWPPGDLFCRTEHFANKTDFVAKLGVLRLRDATNTNVGAVASNGYSADTVFVNTSWKGHMFGAQYSLNPADYVGAQGSWLLNCSSQRAMGAPAPAS